MKTDSELRQVLLTACMKEARRTIGGYEETGGACLSDRRAATRALGNELFDQRKKGIDLKRPAELKFQVGKFKAGALGMAWMAVDLSEPATPSRSCPGLIHRTAHWYFDGIRVSRRSFRFIKFKGR